MSALQPELVMTVTLVAQCGAVFKLNSPSANIDAVLQAVILGAKGDAGDALLVAEAITLQEAQLDFDGA